MDDRLERERSVKLLLSTLDAYIPDPRSQTPTERGFSTDPQRVTCPDCLANDFRHGHRSCETCFGRGVVIVQVQRDPYDTGVSRFDPHADRRRDEARARDAAIAQLQHNERLRDGLFVGAERWEVERARLERAGSYRQLRRCLRQLHGKSPHVHRATVLVHGTLGLLSPSKHACALADVGVSWLAERMPVEIRVPAWVDPETPKEAARRDTVPALAALGYSARKIARTLNMPLKTVKERLRALPMMSSEGVASLPSAGPSSGQWLASKGRPLHALKTPSVAPSVHCC